MRYKLKSICFHVNKYYPYLGGTELLAKQVIDFIASLQQYNITVKTSADQKRNLSDFNYLVEDDIYVRKNQFFDLSVFFSDLWSHQLQNYDVKNSKKNICILNLDEMTYPHKNSLAAVTDKLKKFDYVVTFTKDGIANKFLKDENIKNIYIPNFSRDILQNKSLFSLKEKLQLDNKKTGLYCAAFDQRKNQLTFLNHISQSKILKNYNWIFIGNSSDINYQNMCVQYSKYNKLNNVYFLSSTTEEQKLDTIYQQIDFSILLSLAEGMPLTILESISANKPVIFTPVGGIRGVLRECLNNGAYSTENINYTTQEIESLILKVEKYSGNILRKTWLKEHQKTLVLEEYKKIITDIFK